MVFAGEIIDFRMEGEVLSIRSELLSLSPTPFTSLIIRTSGSKLSFYRKSTEEHLGTFHRYQIGRVAFNRLKGLLWNRAVRESAWWEVIVEGLVDLVQVKPLCYFLPQKVAKTSKRANQG